MKFSKSKWLVYTVLVGLIPILTRVLVWIATKNGTSNLFSAGDFVAFGLILHISIVNELEHLPSSDRSWKTIQNGTSVVFIALYSALYALILVGEKNQNLIDATVMLNSSISLSFVSFVLSLVVFDRISKSNVRGVK